MSRCWWSLHAVRLFLILLIGAMSLSTHAQESSSKKVPSAAPPNIILFMTDDQDVIHRSLDYMPRLNRLFRKEGIEFENYYVPTGLCCPSRATILRGQYCHNTEVYDNGDLSNSTYQSGAWHKFLDTGLEEETLATLMQSAGYETALVGKYMNGYFSANHVPNGYDHWMGMMKMSFYGPVFSENGKELELNHSVYQTDYIRDWVIDFLTNKRDDSKPFFLMVTPFAPHTPATPAKRHEHMFANVQFPRYDSFNPSDDIQRHHPAWIKNMPLLNTDQINDMDGFYRNRLRSLQAIDEALESLVDTLHKLDLEENTWFFYTSDNGQHFGDFRIPAGKRQAYETDVLVPFLVRGPGVQKGTTVKQVVQSVDLLPTFLDLATTRTTLHHNDKKKSSDVSQVILQPSYPIDGKSILPLLLPRPVSPSLSLAHTTTSNDFRWAALLEMYGGSSNIGLRYINTTGYYQNHMFPNTYQAVRVVNGPGWANNANLLYVEWCTGEQELYNMTDDPHQVRNIMVSSTNDVKASAGLQQLVHRLSRLLAHLGDCKGMECHTFQLNDSVTISSTRMLSLRQQSVRHRIRCFNPPNLSSVDSSLGRRPMAMDFPVPEPFTFGFPFSDSDYVSDELLEIWEEIQHYFY